MADQGVITEAEEAEAKAVNVSDMLHPTQFERVVRVLAMKMPTSVPMQYASSCR